MPMKVRMCPLLSINGNPRSGLLRACLRDISLRMRSFRSVFSSLRPYMRVNPTIGREILERASLDEKGGNASGAVKTRSTPERPWIVD